MGKLEIDGTTVDGALSLTGSRSTSGFQITGYIETEAYLGPEYEEIKAGRLIVKDVQIISESFGSETDSIVYEFTAKEYTVLTPQG